ncbi:hypothetical protein SLEP1_g38565 [Rubroshorea leprosula]|nr:hypothetical protein SLEP1_g38565 [Rubroshorea leprosula]
MISKQILKFDLQTLMVSDCDLIKSHKCTAFTTSSDLGSGA